MSKREAIARYHLIIRKLRRAPTNFAEISEYLDRESRLQGYDFRISIRTFQRDLEDIRLIYGIDIEYDKNKEAYLISSEEETEINRRVLEAFDTFNALNITERLSHYIHFEKRKTQGTENISEILAAIQETKKLTFTYQKFWEVGKVSQRLVEPYGLKEFANRWYLIAKDCKDDQIKSFALDRISQLQAGIEKFEYPKGYNVEDAYRYCFGIVSSSENEAEEIILSFEPGQGRYVKSLPLHHTQQIMLDTEEELRIKLQVYITHDFRMELLSYGRAMKVISPQYLIDDIKELHKQAYKQYI